MRRAVVVASPLAEALERLGREGLFPPGAEPTAADILDAYGLGHAIEEARARADADERA